MLDKSKIADIVVAKIAESDLFLVDVTITPDNEIEVTVDSDSRMTIDQCIAINREIESHFDREVEDYSLTVISAGIGQPLTLVRQYKKIIGREIEIVQENGLKLIATLCSVTDDSIEVEYQTKEAVEGKKRKELVTHRVTMPYGSYRSAVEYLKVK